MSSPLRYARSKTAAGSKVLASVFMFCIILWFWNGRVDRPPDVLRSLDEVVTKRSDTNDQSSVPSKDNSFDTLNIFPNIFTTEELESGFVVLHLIGTLYMFLALAIVCDEYFVPALEEISEFLKLTPDVAGATFMAAGGSAPEFFTAMISYNLTGDEPRSIGLGTIMGSAVFNVLLVIGACAIIAPKPLYLTWWPLFRDMVFYTIDLICMVLFFMDGEVSVAEATIMFCLYLIYVCFMKYSGRIELLANNKLDAFFKPADSLTNKVVVMEPAAGVPVDGMETNNTNPKLHPDIVAPEEEESKAVLVPLTGVPDGATDIPNSAPIESALKNIKRDLLSGATVNFDVEAQKGHAPMILETPPIRRSLSDNNLRENRNNLDFFRESKVLPLASLEPVKRPIPMTMTNTEPKRFLLRADTQPVLQKNGATGSMFKHGTRNPREFSRTNSANWVSFKASVGSSLLRPGHKGPLPPITAPTSPIVPSAPTTLSKGEDFGAGFTPAAGSIPPGTGEAPDEEFQNSKLGEKKEEEEEEKEWLVIQCPSPSDSISDIFTFFCTLPLILLLSYTIPDVRNPARQKLFFFSFFISTIWIAVFTSCMISWSMVFAQTIGVPDHVLGLTLLAAGTSIPDFITSVIVAKQGHGDMSVSSSIGSNIFDVTVGLPIPWLIYQIRTGNSVPIDAHSIEVQVVILLLMVFGTAVGIRAVGWQLTTKLGCAMILAYFIFLTQGILLETGVL